MTVSINNRLAESTADISREAAYLAPASSPNQELRTVPTGESWELLGASVTATTTATAGNRTIVIRVRNSAGNVLYQTAAGANLAASQTDAIRNYQIGGSPALAAGIIVPPGLIVEAFDTAAIDATNDVLNLHLMVNKRYNAA